MEITQEDIDWAIRLVQKSRQVTMPKIQIFITDEEERFEIDDLYFFEENGIHWFDEQPFAYPGSGTFFYEILIDGVSVFNSNSKKETE